MELNPTFHLFYLSAGTASHSPPFVTYPVELHPTFHISLFIRWNCIPHFTFFYLSGGIKSHISPFFIYQVELHPIFHLLVIYQVKLNPTFHVTCHFAGRGIGTRVLSDRHIIWPTNKYFTNYFLDPSTHHHGTIW